ncbi:RusA family crossover junction endodeoxyribonuclease [Chitinimonas arctica]|uniref:RusA family crossover junction endodeoxyribonuclease n=1 Tax=Chitinimonas arctica TaxID=2594795 RepID=A0A516SAK6_9NEIS|nr:RusA family crossover junction endodeoxyribonuclease [Chitinimonas arctica]QDQ25180.1 RusA family crossover junction endodeoxyribonuclease [Chitinimonas arctica]
MELKTLSFTVPGEPQGKGRGRIVRWGTKAGIKTPEKTVAYEGLVAHSAAQAMDGVIPIEGAVAVTMRITVSVPGSWPKRRCEQALAGRVLPTTKPDIDNVEKAIFDGLNGVAWCDDVQVVEVRKQKRYGELPGVVVSIQTLEVGAA